MDIKLGFIKHVSSSGDVTDREYELESNSSGSDSNERWYSRYLMYGGLVALSVLSGVAYTYRYRNN